EEYQRSPSWISICLACSRVSKSGIADRIAVRACFASNALPVTHRHRSLFSSPALKYGTSMSRRSSPVLKKCVIWEAHGMEGTTSRPDGACGIDHSYGSFRRDAAFLSVIRQMQLCREQTRAAQLPYSMTSSARASSVGGTSSSSERAALRLIVSTYLV